MRKLPVLLLSILASSTLQAKEKHHEDPTKIVTKAGIAYNDGVQFSGSIGLDEARMINARIDAEGEEWRIGGSWLLPMGILNFNFSRTDYDHGAYNNNYSVGTFVPLDYFGIAPMGWQIFPMAGYSYNDGEMLYQAPDLDDGYILTPVSTHGGYAGAFALKPLSDKWTMMSFAGGSLGSDDYWGYWGGAGMSYKISPAQSFNFYGVLSETSHYGDNNSIGASYKYEFK